MEATAEYFELFLDPELNYSSGYFLEDDMTLAEAQRAKVDAVLRQLRLEPSMRLLDAGCGFGPLCRAAERDYGVRAVGITLSPHQRDYAARRAGAVRVQSWAEFDEPVDRIVSVNSFENFRDKAGFIRHSRSLLPAGGRMVILTVTADRPVFRVISKAEVVRLGEAAGFDVRVSESLARHYARTLDCFRRNLVDRAGEALALVSPEDLERNLSFFATSADLLRSGANEMYEFTFVAR